MAKVGVFNVAPKVWASYDSDTEVFLEFISKDRMGAIVVKADEAAKKVGGKQNALYDMFLGKAAVHGWRKKTDHAHPGLLFPDGRPIEFNEANRNLLMKSCNEFSSFVFRNCTDSEMFLELDTAIDDSMTLEELVNGTELEDAAPKNI